MIDSEDGAGDLKSSLQLQLLFSHSAGPMCTPPSSAPLIWARQCPCGFPFLGCIADAAGRGVTKKRHGHNFEFWALLLNQRGTNHVGHTLIQFQASKINIVAVSLFCDASFPAKFFSEFDPTLTANSYGLKPPNLKNYHIFGILRTFSFTWYPPI